jgi:hypothetical protein
MKNSLEGSGKGKLLFTCYETLGILIVSKNSTKSKSAAQPFKSYRGL